MVNALGSSGTYIVPFIGIKAIDLLLTALHLTGGAA